MMLPDSWRLRLRSREWMIKVLLPVGGVMLGLLLLIGGAYLMSQSADGFRRDAAAQGTSASVAASQAVDIASQVKSACASGQLAQSDALCSAAESVAASPAVTPQGIPGSTGPQGDVGPQGIPGAPGPPGADATGVPGQPGPPGEPGPPGRDGSNGSDGAAGSPGADATGIPGPAGPPGPAGEPGAPGVNGGDGPAGQPPFSWTYTDILGTSYLCSRTDPFDPAAPTYSCAPAK